MLQRNAREVVLGAAGIVLPGVAVSLVAASLAFDRYQSFTGSVVSVPELVGGARGARGAEALLWYVGMFLNSLAACLVGAYATTLVVRRKLGLPISIGAGYRGMWRRLPALLVAWVLGHFWIVLVEVPMSRVRGTALVPLLVFGGPLAVGLSALTLVVTPAIVAERLGPFGAIRRSWRLSRLRFGTMFSFVAASATVGVIVQYGIAYLPRLMQRTGLVAFGRFGWLIEGAAGQLGRLISMPLVAMATALFYLELRMHLEGMDLVIDADRVFGPTA